MKIGIIQAGHSPDPLREVIGDFDDMFARLLDGHGFTFEPFDVEHMQFPSGPLDCEGWLISGSRHGAYEDHAFIAPLEALIRDIIAADRPLVGICFGHQIIAQALGGTVEKFHGGWSLGHKIYTTADGAEIALNAWHQDQVTALPDGAKVLAGNDFCENAVLAYGRQAFTVQAHPEFDNDVLEAYVDLRRDSGLYPPDRINSATDGLHMPLHDRRIGNAIAHFFKTRDTHALA